MKYRILEKGNKFFPQKRVFFSWEYLSYAGQFYIRFSTLEDARSFLASLHEVQVIHKYP